MQLVSGLPLASYKTSVAYIVPSTWRATYSVLSNGTSKPNVDLNNYLKLNDRPYSSTTSHAKMYQNSATMVVQHMYIYRCVYIHMYACIRIYMYIHI